MQQRLSQHKGGRTFSAWENRGSAPHRPPRPSRPARASAPTIPEPILATLRERARITDLFAPADLKKRGSEFLTLCPWHADTNASLTVSPRTNRVHCFVCSKGTDAIGWLQDRQGLTFSEAVQELAGRYNVHLPAADPEEERRTQEHRAERQRLLGWRQEQQEQFHKSLLADLEQAGPASAFLEQRGITPETARTWGLCLNGSRLMLPLADGLSRCCGFSGRTLTGEGPKYSNSANDALFCKSELLFALDRAAPVIRRSGEALLVEGPLDAIQLHQAGLEHTVASLGTSFSLEQAQRLIRCGARRLWIAYDADRAGQQAVARVVASCRPLAIAGELDLLVVSLPAGEDPDSLVHSGGTEAIRSCLAGATHWLEWELDHLLGDLKADPGNLSLLLQAEKEGAAFLAQLPGGVLRHRAEQRLRQALEGFAPPAVPVEADLLGEPQGGGAPSQEQAILQAERRALRLFLHNPELREVLAVLVLSHPLHREAIGCLLHLEQRWRRELEASGVGDAEDGLLDALFGALTLLDPPVAALLAPMARCGDILCKRLRQQAPEELMAILDVLEPVTGCSYELFFAVKIEQYF
jgi:DNA primase